MALRINENNTSFEHLTGRHKENKCVFYIVQPQTYTNAIVNAIGYRLLQQWISKYHETPLNYKNSIVFF